MSYQVEIISKNISAEFWNKSFTTLASARRYMAQLRRTNHAKTVNPLRDLTASKLTYFVNGIVYAHIGTHAVITIRKE